MKYIKDFFSNRIVISFIISVLIYCSLCFQDILVPYNILSFILFGVIYYFIYNVKIDNNYRKDLLLLSSVFSLILIIGRILYSFQYNSKIDFFDEFISLKNIVYFFGNGLLIFFLLSLIVPKLISYQNKNRKINKNVFIISLLIIIICYIPYLIIFFPAIITGDTISEIQMIQNIIPISDHHTLFHVIFMMIPFKIGEFIFDNINISIGLISFTQIIIMSLTFAYTVNFLNKRKLPINIIVIILLFYALLPINGFYSVTLWKDIIFSCSIILLTIECYKLLEKKDNVNFKNSYMFIIVSLFAVFTRNNAIYMYILLTLISIIVFRKQLRVIIPMFIIVFTCYGLVKGPIYNYFGINTSNSSEYLAIPLQQIGRMAYKNVEFTKNEKKLINKLMPIDELKKSYNPEIVDTIKFNKKYNSKVFENNKIKYLKLWLSLCAKHPKIAVEAYMTSTLGYWYPGTEYWVTTASIDKNNLGIKNYSFVSEDNRLKISKIVSNNFPLIGFLNSIGLYIWLTIIISYILIRKVNKKIIYAFTPVFGIWLSILIATPVFSEFRYTYCIVLTLPLFFGMIFINNKINKE